AVLLLEQGHEELDEHAAAVHMLVVVRRDQSLETLRPRLNALLAQEEVTRSIHVRVSTTSDAIEVGPGPTGKTWSRTVDGGGVTVLAELPRAVVWSRVTQLGLLVLGLSVVAFAAAAVA